jgi:Flp pilus assembly pilin Flp
VSRSTLSRLVRLADDEVAQGMVEYLLIVSLVVLMVVGIFGAFIHQFHQ